MNCPPVTLGALKARAGEGTTPGERLTTAISEELAPGGKKLFHETVILDNSALFAALFASAQSDGLGVMLVYNTLACLLLCPICC